MTPREGSSLNTQQLLELALEMAELEETPADSGIIIPAENVKKVMFGVDIDTADLLLAQQLDVDLVIGHHPVTDEPRAEGYKVMKRQIELMTRAGVPINRAQKALRERMEVVDRSSHPRNYTKTGQAARLLGMPLMNLHLPLDIISENTVQAHLDERLEAKAKLTDVMEALAELPEYDEPAGPRIRCGSPEDYAGRVTVRMAQGTNGGARVMKAYFEAGVGTLVLMHIPEEALEAVKEQGIGNIVIAGHMRSDSVGINKFIGALEERGLEVIRMGGVTET
jgi:putative NIF3 family GTP cyclohydrolase 1 type 2